MTASNENSSGNSQDASTAALTAKQRRHLRALAHHLKPVVQIGNKGCTDAVLEQVDQQLESHELIKLKVGQDAPVEYPEVIRWVEGTLSARCVQRLGRTLIFFRSRKKNAAIRLP
ncbi:MAG: ribosome assembly RNA-binding protein YhbY [Myxococcales bacterium]|nr:ribosome assembly RNA-binding protein YhbY [Myxococcales bacterium]